MREPGASYQSRGQFLSRLTLQELVPVALAVPFAALYFFQVVPFAEQRWYHYLLVILAVVGVTRIPNYLAMTRVVLPPAFEWIRYRRERRQLSQGELSRLYIQLTWLVPRMQILAALLGLVSDLIMIVYARLFLLKSWMGLVTMAFTMLIATVLSLCFSYFSFTALVRPLLEDVSHELQQRPREGTFHVSLRLKIGASIFGLILLALLAYGLLMAVKVRTLFENYALTVNHAAASRLAGDLGGTGELVDPAGPVGSLSDETRIFMLADAEGNLAVDVNRQFWSRDVQEAVQVAAKRKEALVKVTTESQPLWIYGVQNRPLFLVLMAHPAKVHEGVRALLSRTAVFLVAILFLIGVYIVWLTREVMRMVNAGAQFNRRLAEGDLTEVPAEWSDDELGDMAEDLRVTFRGLTRLAQEIRGASEVVDAEAERLAATSRDLLSAVSEQASLAEETTRSSRETQHSMSLVSQSMSQVASATQDVSATILQMRANVEEITGTAEVLSGSVETTVSSTNEIASVAENVRAATDHLRRSSEEAVSFLTELGTSLTETRGHSESLSQLAHHVTSLAASGSENVGAVEQQVGRSLDGLEASYKAMTELRSATDSIGRILDVIQDITDQTNLLSLNASIIAAGAGEHGKAFGVVATQIRELSAKSKMRSAEIRDVIRSIQRGGQEINTSLEQLHLMVSKSSELSREAGASLKSILTAASEQEDMTSRIAAASEELAHGGQSAGRTIQRIFEMIEGISRSVEEQADSTRLLTTEAEKVRDGVLHLRRATEEQARGAHVISEATASISQDSQNTSKTVQSQADRSLTTVKGMQHLLERAQAVHGAFQELAEASVRLEKSAKALDQQVRKFKIPER